MPHSSEDEDEFLNCVFPGGSPSAVRFRGEVTQLNRYCKRYRGGINCILLTGETGVGKNYTARGISAHSQWLTLADDERRDLFYDKHGRIALAPTALIERLLFKEHRASRESNPQRVPRLATVLGPQLADDLAASELFGHTKNAFTGATKEHLGIFGDDSVDDVFLDEIADLSLNVQTKLLQFIENRTFRPVGAAAGVERSSEHRLFLATNRPLETWVRDGKFREDLYWRIRGYRINIPPLRDRRDIIRDIASAVLAAVNQRHRGNKERGPSLTPDADRYCQLPESEWQFGEPLYSNWVTRLEDDDLVWCQRYDWPGNIRELRQRMELYVFHNGHRRLCDVQETPADFHDTTLEQEQHSQVTSLVSRAVSQYVSDVLDGSTPTPGQPGSLLTHFDRLVKRAFLQVRADRPLSREEMTHLFPHAKDLETALSRWRGANEVT